MAEGKQEAAAYLVVLYYKYVRLGDTDDEIKAIIASHVELCESLSLKGRVRIAKEGINGTLAGQHAKVQAYIAAMKALPCFAGIDWKTSSAAIQPFDELHVRHCEEIVAMEIPDAQCDLRHGGTHLTPEQFHHEQQNGDPHDMAIIDVRNNYEYDIGHFEGAMNPNTRRFGQFPEWVHAELPTLEKKSKILMYCTGGIRCEKASAYLKHLGLQKVYQLQGGIHRYLETFPDGGLFRGKNFVFDHRVSMASSDTTITGRCKQCTQPYDMVTGQTRCAYCRCHVLLCEDCAHNLKYVACDDHAHLFQGNKEELQAQADVINKELQETLGKNRKGRRRSLRKQLDTILMRIQEL